jgi:hypothetical protein
MDKFDLKKFLVENKLTQQGRLAEGYHSMRLDRTADRLAYNSPKKVEDEEEVHLEPEAEDLYGDVGVSSGEQAPYKPLGGGEGPSEDDDDVDFSKYSSVEELMKEIESSTNEAAQKHKIERVKKAFETLESTATSLEEGEHASYISPAKLKEMKTSAKKLRKMHERLVKEYDKKYAKSKDEKAISLQEILSDDAYDRISGLVPLSALGAFQEAIDIISSDLIGEGFDAEDIIEYLQTVVRDSVK